MTITDVYDNTRSFMHAADLSTKIAPRTSAQRSVTAPCTLSLISSWFDHNYLTLVISKRSATRCHTNFSASAGAAVVTTIERGILVSDGIDGSRLFETKIEAVILSDYNGVMQTVLAPSF
jgi:hypothetical protein